MSAGNKIFLNKALLSDPQTLAKAVFHEYCHLRYPIGQEKSILECQDNFFNLVFPNYSISTSLEIGRITPFDLEVSFIKLRKVARNLQY
ncbi:MAG: hypothetical protein NZO16_01005 [Deltaproteobacteria bacterium]|nr:hypothetical protein [Deltaproteobacteria bacterium]